MINNQKITSLPCSTLAVYEHKEASPIDKVDSTCRSKLENRFLATYKALHFGGKETLESKMIRFASIIYPTHSEQETSLRHANYNTVNQCLSQLTDKQISTLLNNARVLGSGIGGEVLSTEIDGVKVFIKKIPLTDIEQKNPGSTLNLFELPPNYQYGVGSMGFGVGREIAAHEITTNWVLNGECQNFPLMYHSRALPRSTLPLPSTEEDLKNREDYVAYWDGAKAVGVRDNAVATASADVVVFMEYFPQTLAKWLSKDNGNHLTESAMTGVEHELFKVAAFMKSQGFIHFDGHCYNIQHNNNHIYFADFGLAMSQEFELSPNEISFFKKHVDYDRYYVASALARGAIDATLGEGKSELVLNNYRSNGKIEIPLPHAIKPIVEKYLPVASVMDEFFHSLQVQSKSIAFPKDSLARKWNKL